MKNILKSGDRFIVEFTPSDKAGTKPVCRINGKIGIIHKQCRVFVQTGSSWMVEVIEDKGRFATVIPVSRDHTRQENEDRLQDMLAELRVKRKITL